MIAVTFALPNESSDFTKALRSNRLHDREVRVLHTGVGETAALRAIEQFLARAPLPNFLISAGFAGAIDDRLHVGDLLLADNFSDANLLASARDALAQMAAHCAPLATAHTIIDSAHERQKLARRSGALAVDMETEFIAQACATAAIPMLSLRVITDTPAAPFPAPPRVLFNLEKQKIEFTRLAFYLLGRPTAIAGLIAFSKRVAHARRQLMAALNVLVRDLD